MNLENRLSNFALFGLLCLSAVSAYSSYKTREELKRLERSAKKMEKKLSDIKKTLNDQKESGDGFVTAFRLDMSENGEEERKERVDDRDLDASNSYTVREYNGVIGVFNDEEELVRSIDTKVSLLQASDRQSLLLGIRAESDEELEKILDGFYVNT